MALILSACAFILSTIGLLIGCLAYAEIIGLKNSTHKIQYIDPSQQMFEELTEEKKKVMRGMEPLDSMI
jgi:hypothetical protein